MKVDLNFSLHSLKISSLPSIKLKPDHFSDVFLCITNNSILYQWSLNFFVSQRIALFKKIATQKHQASHIFSLKLGCLVSSMHFWEPLGLPTK